MMMTWQLGGLMTWIHNAATHDKHIPLVWLYGSCIVCMIAIGNYSCCLL